MPSMSLLYRALFEVNFTEKTIISCITEGKASFFFKTAIEAGEKCIFNLA